MSMRAIIAVSSADGTWKGVWHEEDGAPQLLGGKLLRQVTKQKGDLDKLVNELIETVPEGWALFPEERSEESMGFLYGTFDGIVANCDPAKNPRCYQAQYLYIFHPPKRRLYVFNVEKKVMRPFGMVNFEESGKAAPRKFPPDPKLEND